MLLHSKNVPRSVASNQISRTSIRISAETRCSEAAIHLKCSARQPQCFSVAPDPWFASVRPKQHSPNEIGARLTANGRQNSIHRTGAVDSPGKYAILMADSFEWMSSRKADSIHAIVTDPPYGLKEYTEGEKNKLRAGRGGVWRIPPSFDGCKRSPLPRFTVLSEQEVSALRRFFEEFCATRTSHSRPQERTSLSPRIRCCHI